MSRDKNPVVRVNSEQNSWSVPVSGRYISHRQTGNHLLSLEVTELQRLAHWPWCSDWPDRKLSGVIVPLSIDFAKVGAWTCVKGEGGGTSSIKGTW